MANATKKKYREINKEKYEKYQAMYKEKNKDMLSEKYRSYYQNANVKKRHSEWLAEWRNKNSDKVQVYKLKRRTLEKSLPSTLTSKEWVECKNYFDNKCAYCGSESKLSLDHFIPVTKGGELSKENSIPSCKSCNSSKNNNEFKIWYKNQKFYSKTREQKILKYLGYKNNNQQLTLTI